VLLTLLLTCRLMQEQEAWLQLLAQYNDMASAAPPASAAAAASPDSSPSTHQQQQPTDRQTPSLEAAGVEAGPATGACYGGPEGGADGPVSAQQQESLLGVELKVEVLTALVSKMEHLVARAEATARTLQVRSSSWLPWSVQQRQLGCSRLLHHGAGQQGARCISARKCQVAFLNSTHLLTVAQH